MNNQPFIGIGNNPDGKDLPLGLGMQLAQDTTAMSSYARLTQPQRDRIVGYVQGCTTGEDAKNRIANVIQGLKDGQTNF